MGFHPDDSREPALNRERKLARVQAGRAHAALVFDGDDCVGWCQFGAPDEVPKIKNRAAYERSVTTLPDWRIACNFVGKGHRRKGVATAALVGALELIARLGGGNVEGYPEDAGSVPAGFLFNGALSTYEKSVTTVPDWRIACNFVGKGHRRKGVATAALAGALDLIASLGGGKVEGYPEGAGSVPAGFLFNGALSTYEKLGFVRDRKIGKHRWVVTKVVEPTS